ncbi:MAG: tyrosine-type recombinase/integrase [Streptomyces sp.]|jgi:integrase|nr:tyrosine-type recombinase/integrase [Streptomyces sp.]
MARRGAGEGSIDHRSDGRWRVRLTVSPDGRRREWYAQTKAQAVETLRIERERLSLGVVGTTGRLTVGQYLNGWLESVTGDVKPSTEAHYRLVVTRHLVPALGRIPLERLTAAHVDAFLRSERGQVADRTRHHHRAVLRRALNRAVRQHLIARNPAAEADPITIRDARPACFLTPDQAAQVLEAVATDRLAALYTVALALGLRQGEALGLQWHDVDFTHRRLTVRRQLQRIGGESRFVPLKSARSELERTRVLPMPAVVVEALQVHRARQGHELGTVPLPTGLVFCRRDGSPLINSNVTKGFQTLLERSGLPRMRFHDLRHSCASLLIAQGVAPRTVMEILGHSSISTTMNIYAHVGAALLEESSAAMDRLLGRRN